MTQAEKDQILTYLDRLKSAQASGLSNASLAYKAVEQIPVDDAATV